MAESSSGEGLTVTYDEETLTITFDWDPETHPEYNFLSSWTAQDLTQMLTEYLNQSDPQFNDQSQASLQSGGPGSGEAESICDSWANA
jgi:hypothetical protein